MDHTLGPRAIEVHDFVGTELQAGLVATVIALVIVAFLYHADWIPLLKGSVLCANS